MYDEVWRCAQCSTVNVGYRFCQRCRAARSRPPSEPTAAVLLDTQPPPRSQLREHFGPQRIIAIVVALVVVPVALGALKHDSSANQRVADYLSGTGQKEFFASDSQFRATFPKLPQRTIQHLDLGHVSQDVTMYTAGDDDRQFGVGSFPLTGGEPFDLGLSVNGAAVGSGGHVERSTLTSFAGFPAAEAVISTHGKHLELLAVRAPERVYELIVVGSDDPPAGYDTFKKSFQIM